MLDGVPATGVVRVVIADDEPAFRAALAEVIDFEPALELVGVAADADEAVQLAGEHRPDVVVSDVRMPGGGGEAVARGLAACEPPVGVIALSAYDDKATIADMLRAGAVGYVLKGSPMAEIVDAIHRAAAPGNDIAAAEQAPAEVAASGAEPPAVRTDAEAIRVLVVDDNWTLLRALGDLVEDDPELTLAGLAHDVHQAARMATLYKPDVALVDRYMTGGDGPQVVREIRSGSPDTVVVAISHSEDPSAVLEMLEAGASSYVVKSVSSAELLRAVHRAAAGQRTFSPQITAPVVADLILRLDANDAEARTRAEREPRIRAAIEGGSLRACFQPIVDAETEATVAVEALARFDGDPGRTPDVWFSEAAALGLGEELDMTAARTAIATFAAEGGEVDLHLNLRPETILAGGVLELLDGIDPRRLIIEVTEHTAVEDYAALARALAPLRAEGVRLAVDDAGAGYASLRHVLELGPDCLKLDISLCRGIHRDRMKSLLAATLVSFAEQIGAEVVAEGVEEQAELDELRRLGARYVQGYLLGAPESLDKVHTDSGAAA